MNQLVARALSIGALSFLFFACSSSANKATDNGTIGASTGGGGGIGGDPAVSSATCKSTCETRATACGAGAGNATTECASICGGTVTQSQLGCLENKACADLASVKDPASFAAACPATGGVSGSTTDAGSATTTPVCNAPGARCLDGECCVVPQCKCVDGQTNPQVSLCDNHVCISCSSFCLERNGSMCPILNAGDPCGDARPDGCFSCSSHSCGSAKTDVCD